MANTFLCGRYEFDLERPLVMGIVNVTPDSFSDGGDHFDPDAAIAHGLRLQRDGAHILDLGGESTRPGAPAVSADEELRRVLPVVEGLRDCGVPVSVDTFKPEVMKAVLDAGADMINDIYGFRQPGAIDAVAGSRCGLCVMHMKGEPGTMQTRPNMPTCWARSASSWGPARSACARPGSSRAASCWTRASASARRPSTITSCCAGWPACACPATRCWWACRASR